MSIVQVRENNLLIFAVFRDLNDNNKWKIGIFSHEGNLLASKKIEYNSLVPSSETFYFNAALDVKDFDGDGNLEVVLTWDPSPFTSGDGFYVDAYEVKAGVLDEGGYSIIWQTFQNDPAHTGSYP